MNERDLGHNTMAPYIILGSIDIAKVLAELVQMVSIEKKSMPNS